MTYGIDQCRRCGKPIPQPSPDAARRYEQSLLTKPTMTEAQWRAAGWKAAPTRYQMFDVLDGLCRECKWVFGNRKSGRWRVLGIVLAAAALLASLVITIFVFARSY